MLVKQEVKQEVKKELYQLNCNMATNCRSKYAFGSLENKIKEDIFEN